MAQEQRVQNRPYTDLRPFHFGVVVGTHLQDIELTNVGPVTIIDEDGNATESLVTCDQDRWDNGFNVGVLAEARINQHFAFRAAPAVYFGTRHFTFRNFTVPDTSGEPQEKHQEMKSAYFSCAFDLIFAARRVNNHRPYVMAGLNPMMNLTGKSDDYLKLNRTELFFEAGVGCDFYLPFFKLRPELKFLYGLTNSLDSKHASQLRDKSMLPYTQSVNKATSKMIVLSFYFE